MATPASVQLVVKGAGIVRLEPECDAPAQVLDFREVH